MWTALAGLAGSLYANSANQASAQASMDFQKEVLQNRNQWAVEDLKKAGLNPILAAGATQSSAAGAQASNENPVNSAISSASQANAMKLAQRQQKNQDAITAATIQLTSAKTATELEKAKDYIEKRPTYGAQVNMFGSSARFNDANIEYLGKQSEKIGAEIETLNSKLKTMESERDYLAAQVKTANSQADRNRAEAALAQKEGVIADIKAETQKLTNDGLTIENRLKELGVNKAISDSEYYGKTGNKFMNENVWNPFRWKNSR